MRYFFDIFLNGEHIPDPEGTELPSEEAAQKEAIASAKELSMEFPQRKSSTGANIIEVADGSGRRIIALPIYSQHLAPERT